MTRIKQIIFVLLTVIVVVIVIAGLVSLRNVFVKEPYKFTASSKTVIKELRELNRLETSSFTIEKVIDARTNGNRFQELLFGDRILLIAHGEVIAGFDMSKLKDEDVVIKNDTLSLTLPAPEILVTDLDNKETRVYDRRTGLLTEGDQNLESQARQAAEETIREAACQGGILQEATNNARSQLTALFKTLGFTSVDIAIPQTTCS